MKIFIVEDEELAVKRLRSLLQEVLPEAQVVGDADSIEASVAWLKNNPGPDLILMDIELVDGQSFAIFEQVEIKCPVIFTTSYDEYAIQAFRVNSVAYLLKPIEPEDLEAALEKYTQLKQFYNLQDSALSVSHLVEELQLRLKPKEYRKRFLVKHGSRLTSVEVPGIAYFFAEGKFIFFRTTEGKKFVIDYTLDEVQEMLPPADFFRINRSFLISLQSVQKMDDYFGQRLILGLHPAAAEDAIVSREKVTQFKTWMGK